MNFSFINMKIIFLLLLLQQTFEMGRCINFSTHFKAETESPRVNDIVMKWKDSEAAVRKAFIRLVQNMLPSVYEIVVTTNISVNCTTGLVEFVKGLTNQKLWAFRMLDSFGKLPNGLMGGSPTSFGDYDTCIETVGPNRKFKGKYCLINLSLPLPKRHLFSRVDEGIPEFIRAMEPETVGEELAKNALYLYITQLSTSLCLPSSCSTEEVKIIVQKGMELGEYGFEGDVLYCEIKDHIRFTSGEISIIIIFCALICLVVVGTIIDVLLELKSKKECSKKGVLLKCILCFSASANLSRILKTDKNPENLTVFHGLRVISMFWVILCHTYFTVNYRAYDGLLRSKDIAKAFWFQIINNGFLSVEAFFFMSSALVAYACMRVKGKINIPLYFFKRYWRLTPPMMLVTAFFTVAGQFGSGPVWRETVIDRLSNNCKERGWWNFFYINNYFYSPDICMGWTWYLSADIHLFLISLLVLIVLKRSIKRGFLAIGFLLIIGILATAFTHIYYDLPPTFLQSFVSHEDWYYYGSKAYTPTHIHLPVCCIGLAVGYILATKKVRLPKHVNVIGWIVTIMTLFTMLFGVYYWNQGHVPGVLVSALYGSTHRVIWTLCLAFITISCTAGQGGVVQSILSWEAFVPLGRLTYMAYLIHYGIIYLYVGSTRSTMTFNHRFMIFLYFGVVSITFATSFLLSLIFESPFMSLEKVLSNGYVEKMMYPVTADSGTKRKCMKVSV